MLPLDPAEAQLVLDLLRAGPVLPGRALAALRLQQRIERDGFALGRHVFRMELALTETALAAARPAVRERAKLRKELGTPGKPLKALPRGIGPKVVIPPHAPTLNEYNGLTPWQKENLRDAIDHVIAQAKGRWPWTMGVIRREVIEKKKRKPVIEGGRRRVVVVTRFSAAPMDELSTDACGGKIPIDRLVHADVLRGDTPEWVGRVAYWKQVAPTEGRVVIDVHEIEPLT